MNHTTKSSGALLRVVAIIGAYLHLSTVINKAVRRRASPSVLQESGVVTFRGFLDQTNRRREVTSPHLKGKTVLRYSLVVISIVLGAAIHFGNFDSYEVQYVVAFQQAALATNTMWFFQLYTHIGDSIIWIGLALLLFAFYYKRPRKALKFALFIAMVAVVVTALRFVFPRERPFQAFPALVQAYANEGIPSYPSGHVASAAGSFYLLANHSRRLNALFAALVVLLGVSRVAMGIHYPTDEIGAALFSYPLAAIIDDMKLFERFRERLDSAIANVV
jgi:undecaprenyl-diphosphatase